MQQHIKKAKLLPDDELCAIYSGAIAASRQGTSTTGDFADNLTANDDNDLEWLFD
jgi:hypothetical protein